MKKIMMMVVFFVSLNAINYGIFNTQSVDALNTFNITVKLTREPATDIERQDIFTITVDYAAPAATSGQTYNILYFLDDRFEEEFKAQSLPFSFKRNLRGQNTGTHTVRIDIEDNQDHVLASSTVGVDVLSAEN